MVCMLYLPVTIVLIPAQPEDLSQNFEVKHRIIPYKSIYKF